MEQDSTSKTFSDWYTDEESFKTHSRSSRSVFVRLQLGTCMFVHPSLNVCVCVSVEWQVCTPPPRDMASSVHLVNGDNQYHYANKAHPEGEEPVPAKPPSLTQCGAPGLKHKHIP